MNYNVVEHFVSINGEGVKAGELAVFVRFKGCNLNCGYCDTKWANIPLIIRQIITPSVIYHRYYTIYSSTSSRIDFLLY